MKRILVGVFATASLAISFVLVAIPSLKPHGHDTSSVLWEADLTRDGSTYHNHAFPRSFGGPLIPRFPYNALGCWDNKFLNFDLVGLFVQGHCFIDWRSSPTNIPTYYFLGPWPSAAKDRMRDAFEIYNTTSTPLPTTEIGIRFEEAVSSGAADIELIWDTGGYLDSLGRAPSIAAEWFPWYQPKPQLYVRPQTYFLWNYSAGTGIPTSNYHFFSVALHEVGHIVGLAHSATGGASLMDSNPNLGAPADAPGQHVYFTSMDSLTRNGVRDLYSQTKPPPPTYQTCSAAFAGCFINRPNWMVTARSSDAPIDSMDWERSPNGSSWTTAYPATACNVFVGEHRFTWIGTSGYFEYLRGQINTYYGSSAYCTLAMNITCGGGTVPFAVGPSPDGTMTPTTDDRQLNGKNDPKSGRGPNGEVIEPGTVFYGTITEDGVPPEYKGRKGSGAKSGSQSPLLDTLKEIKSEASSL